MDVVAGVFTDEDRVLGCRRRPGIPEAGRWEFPGGKVEPGENPQQALARELLEELGVVVEVGDLIDCSTTMVNEVPITLSCYHVRAVSEVGPVSNDHDQLSWFARERLLWLDWAEPDLPCVRRLSRIDPPE